MDWTLFWTAAGVVVALGSLFLGCFLSVAKQISNIGARLISLEAKVDKLEQNMSNVDHRLSKIEGAFEERGRWESRKS